MEFYLIFFYDSKFSGYNIQFGGNCFWEKQNKINEKQPHKNKGIHCSPKTEFDGTMCGENHPEAVLTLNDVNSIREEYKTTNISQRKLAKKYNVSQRHIYRIVNNESWVTSNKIEFDEGVNHSNKKLNDQEIEGIQVEYLNGNISQLKLGEKYNVSQKTIWRIVNGK